MFLKRVAFCLALIVLSAFVAQAQVYNCTRILHGRLEIRQNGRRTIPMYDVEEGVYHLSKRFEMDTIILSLKSVHNTTMHVCMVYYDVNKYTTVGYKEMNTKCGYPFMITPEANGEREYMCFFYSIDELNVDAIVDMMNEKRGKLFDKLHGALSTMRMIPQKDIRFVMNEIEFSARTDKTVVPVIIEIVH